MLRKFLFLTTLMVVYGAGFARAQDSDYGAVDHFFMANPNLPDTRQYAARIVNPHYILIGWDSQEDMDQRMTSNGFVRLGVSNWVYDHANPYEGTGVPQRDLAISYARALGADVVIYATRSSDYDDGAQKNEHAVWFYARQGYDGPHKDLSHPATPNIPSNAEASEAMNRLQDYKHLPRVKGGVWYDPKTDTYNWIGPKLGRRMTEKASEFLSEVGPYLY